jgi:hypothetical protein
MSFLTIACDKLVKVFSFFGFATLLLVFVLSCATPVQQKQVCPAAAVKKSEREETLPSVKPGTPTMITEPQTSPKRTTSPEIEVHDNLQIDSAPIEKE